MKQFNILTFQVFAGTLTSEEVSRKSTGSVGSPKASIIQTAQMCQGCWVSAPPGQLPPQFFFSPVVDDDDDAQDN